ncbi:heme-binding domain-containing protein [Flavivirga amylovorans]|uniref:Heme-binding domain-containing protein n=1 Tax=Flavivirga amylovorans TaxID=870486 RepID=A0ABT8WXS6_9FLAO|nr:heme-binding domain-containing protein [Flavivirga amylovorans]MDO5986490.1 heme-binding domain-containing protein [Flavivirga amylovorans]
MKIIKKILIALLFTLVLIQFYRPEKNDADYRDVAAFEAETKPSEDVAAILKAQCYDCHSNKTAYPWYAEIAPISFWIGHHIEEGNEHFNVSKWNAYNDKKKDHKLDELIEEVEEGEMPLNSYTWMHGAITKEEKEALITWAKKARESYNVK